MRKVIYRGELNKLYGKSAITHHSPNDPIITVQFDDLSLGSFAYGWHAMDAKIFEFIEDRSWK